MSLIDQSSFLCLILDVVSLMQQEISVEKALGAVILYCNSFLLMHRHNRLVIMVVCGDEFRVIYPPVSHSNPNLNPVFHELSTIVETQLLAQRDAAILQRAQLERMDAKLDRLIERGAK